MGTICPAILFGRPATLVWKFEIVNFSISRFFHFSNTNTKYKNSRAYYYSGGSNVIV